MPKIAKKLGALEVQRLTEVKLHQVGTVPGLGLSISKTGAKSWILRTTIGARRSDIGLGSYPAITLAKACELARETRAVIRAGADPVAERRAKQARLNGRSSVALWPTSPDSMSGPDQSQPSDPVHPAMSGSHGRIFPLAPSMSDLFTVRLSTHSSRDPPRFASG